MPYQFRPIHKWPVAQTKQRQNARFRAQHAKTLRDLETELHHGL